MSEGEISRTCGDFEDLDSIPAERSSSSISSSGVVRKKANGFSSMASLSPASSPRIRRMVGGHESRRDGSLKGIAMLPFVAWESEGIEIYFVPGSRPVYVFADLLGGYKCPKQTNRKCA